MCVSAFATSQAGRRSFFSQYHETNVNKYNAFNAMQLSSLVELESLGPGPRAWARSLRARRWAWGKPLNWASGYSVGPGFGSSAGACAWASVCLGRSLCVGRRARPRAVGQGEESGVGVRARPGTEPTGPYPVVTGKCNFNVSRTRMYCPSSRKPCPANGSPNSRQE